MLLKNNSFSIFLPPFYQLLAESFHFFPFSLLPSGTSGLLAFGSLAGVRYGPASTFVAMLFHRYASPPIQSRSDLSYRSASLSVAFCNFFCTIPFQYLTFLALVFSPSPVNLRFCQQHQSCRTNIPEHCLLFHDPFHFPDHSHIRHPAFTNSNPVFRFCPILPPTFVPKIRIKFQRNEN